MIRIDRLQERMAALGYNPNLTAQIAGLGRDYVRDIIRGKVKEPSAIRLRRLADALRCSPEYLTGDADITTPRPRAERFFSTSPLVVELPITHIVRTGFHEEAGEVPADINWPVRTLDAHDKSQWLEYLSHDITELGYKSGSLLHVIDLEIVDANGVGIFERTSVGGDLVERSVRRADFSLGKFTLTPPIKKDHADRQFDTIELVTGRNDLNLRLVGQVVAVYHFLNDTAGKWIRDPTRIYG